MEAPEPQTAEERDAEAQARAAASYFVSGALVAMLVMFILSKALMP